MKIIGVTGISGSGTSTAATILQEMGGYIISADELAHASMMRDKEAYTQIVNYFGNEIVNTNGEIDRKKLGALVFGKPELLALLEGFIHPQVWKDTEILLEEARLNNYPFAVIDAPLLIEAGMHTMCDTTVLITASDTTRAERIMQRDNISPESAVRRLASRAGDEARIPYAQAVLENEGDINTLREKIQQVITL
ncbi:MAG: dephospho-CoA kinase [Defluviitaleaceae bacterium]|nr:dephospho-CoA kinase [Defluviitaleaceae bacterium]MCL2273744.1 dephospho-CoA kinase [Defluviitaleaceae bacterium]